MENLVSFGDIYRGKRVLITGETGFKGSWLALWLHQLGADVYACSRDIPSVPSLFEELDLESLIHHTWMDVTHFTAFSEFVTQIQPDFIFHLAAQAIVKTAYTDPLDTFNSNIMGTAVVLEAAKYLTKPCQLICITSDKCYENVEWMWGYRENDRLGGKDPYSASKGCAELVFSSYYHSFFQNHPVQLCSTRAGNVIGGGDWAADRIVPDSVRAWGKRQPVVLRSPESTRPWQHVLEPLSGYLLLGQKMASTRLSGESYNFGPAMDQNYTVYQLVSQLQKDWANAFPAMVTLNPHSNFKEATLLKLDCEKSALQLSWAPTLDFEETAKMTAEWYSHYFEQDQPLLQFTSAQILEYTHLAFQKDRTWVNQA